MRQIGHLRDETQAKRLGDYLDGEGIENHVERDSSGQWEIWVLNETTIDRAQALFGQFSERPDDPIFEAGARAAARKRQDDQKMQTPRRGRVIEGRTVFYSPPVPVGLLTISLIVISVAVSLLTRLGEDSRWVQPLSITTCHEEGDDLVWDTRLPEVRHGQIWRLFTPMFLHFGVMHLFFNMLWLRDLGSMIEARRGRAMLLGLVLGIAATSNVAQHLVSGPTFGGMSGVVYGLFGYMWMQSRFNPASDLVLQPQTVTLMIVWFLVCLTGLVGHVANTAHAVGLGVGVVWGYVAALLAARR